MDVATRRVNVEPIDNGGMHAAGSALTTGNFHRPCGFGRNGAVFGVAPPRNE